jgi:uncharacterized membrane protein YdbT with pleckstrin-like domain
MNKPVPIPPTAPVAASTSTSQEKIIFETQPLLLPTILSLENLVIIGFSFVIAIMAVVFRLGFSELLIIALLYLLIAFPSFRQIFLAGSTNYVLTNRRLVIFTVGFGPKERSIPLGQIQDIRVRHSGLQRLYGAGDIIIYPKGLSRAVRMRGLQEVRKRAEQIQQAMKKV